MSNPAEPQAGEPVVRRLFEADPGDLWERLTSADGFEQWMGSGSTFEPEPGGDLIAADPESGEPKIGRVLTIQPGRHLHWVWRPLGDPDGNGSTEVIISLEPCDEPAPATIVTVIEIPSPLTVAPAGLSTALALATACR